MKCFGLMLALALPAAAYGADDAAALREQLDAAKKEIAQLKAQLKQNDLPVGATILQQLVFADLEMVLPEKHPLQALYAKSLAKLQKQFPAKSEKQNVDLLFTAHRELLKADVNMSVLEMLQDIPASAAGGHLDDEPKDLSTYLRVWIGLKKQQKK